MKRWVKDPFPGMSHFVGALLSVLALVVLLVAAHGRAWYVVSFAIYGSTLILLYAASALAHSLHCSPRVEAWLDRCDYTAIFLLIAGTYTPLCLITLRGPTGWWLLAGVWGLALSGIASLYIWKSRKNWPRVLVYLLMGWLSVLAIRSIVGALPAAGVAWLFGGGMVYSLGAVVFMTNRPNLWPGRFVAHDLWHVMVLTGSACHFILMLVFVAP
jgi:hemolysin III